MCVENATGETLTICDGYVVLDSYVSLDLHYEVSPVEYGGDGGVVKAADYGEVLSCLYIKKQQKTCWKN